MTLILVYLYLHALKWDRLVLLNAQQSHYCYMKSGCVLQLVWFQRHTHIAIWSLYIYIPFCSVPQASNQLNSDFSSKRNPSLITAKGRIYVIRLHSVMWVRLWGVMSLHSKTRSTHHVVCITKPYMEGANALSLSVLHRPQIGSTCGRYMYDIISMAHNYHGTWMI